MSLTERIALAGIVFTVVSAIGGLLLRYLNMRVDDLRRDLEETERAGENGRSALRIEIGFVKDALRQHEKEVAQEYVRHSYMTAFEDRLLARFDRLEAKFDRMSTSREPQE